MDAAALWGTFAEHAALVMSGGRAPARASGPGWFAVLTGEAHFELNECALTSRADAADARALVAFVSTAGVPALLSVASGAAAGVTEPLVAAGFAPGPEHEPLMWCPRRLPVAAGALRVEPVRSQADRERAIAIVADAHAMDAAAAGRALAPLPDRTGRVTAWLAFEGDEPISVVWTTAGRRIGVWEMMTPARHRRKGAARAALTTALDRIWSDDTEGAFLWSTPAGRPFYESVGFASVDDATSWTLGADPELLAAIGQPVG
ncbi:MAG TPA: GNAT family N-acetyltransferase [Gaiellales bacterium]